MSSNSSGDGNHVEALHLTLQQSFSPDANLRMPAEERIRNLKHIPGSTVLLLHVVAEKQVRDVTVVVAWQHFIVIII